MHTLDIILGFVLIWEMHAGGLVRHFERDKIIALDEDRFYWPSLKKECC